MNQRRCPTFGERYNQKKLPAETIRGESALDKEKSDMMQGMDTGPLK
jgi:hypothetical protein